MRVWLVSTAIAFVLAEIYLSIKDFILPLPIYILGGAFLAIASNYDKGIMALFRQESLANQEIIAQNATLVEEQNILTAEQAQKSQKKKFPN